MLSGFGSSNSLSCASAHGSWRGTWYACVRGQPAPFQISYTSTFFQRNSAQDHLQRKPDLWIETGWSWKTQKRRLLVEITSTVEISAECCERRLLYLPYSVIMLSDFITETRFSFSAMQALLSPIFWQCRHLQLVLRSGKWLNLTNS